MANTFRMPIDRRVTGSAFETYCQTFSEAMVGDSQVDVRQPQNLPPRIPMLRILGIYETPGQDAKRREEVLNIVKENVPSLALERTVLFDGWDVSKPDKHGNLYLLLYPCADDRQVMTDERRAVVETLEPLLPFGPSGAIWDPNLTEDPNITIAFIGSQAPSQSRKRIGDFMEAHVTDTGIVTATMQPASSYSRSLGTYTFGKLA